MLRFEEPSADSLVPAIQGGGIAVGEIVISIRRFESYWMLSLCNRQTVVVAAAGVRGTHGPDPNILGQLIPRVETRDSRRVHCYSRDADPQTARAAIGLGWLWEQR